MPERFDINNELFYPVENTGKKIRHPLSYIPFSFGTRNCPGKTLANLELKTLIVHFLSRFEYELDSEQKQNDYVRFSLRSQFDLKLKITKKK